MATTQVILIETAEEWFEKYKPIRNPFSENAGGWNGTMFETYGKEMDFVRAMPRENVWTWVDGDDGKDYIVSGFHFVNRIGYFVCGIAEDRMVEVKAWDDDDYPDDIECECGNTPHSNGFYPCLPDGTEVEPVIGGDWDGESYVCGRCGTVCTG